MDSNQAVMILSLGLLLAASLWLIAIQAFGIKKKLDELIRVLKDGPDHRERGRLE